MNDPTNPPTPPPTEPDRQPTDAPPPVVEPATVQPQPAAEPTGTSEPVQAVTPEQPITPTDERSVFDQPVEKTPEQPAVEPVAEPTTPEPEPAPAADPTQPVFDQPEPITTPTEPTPAPAPATVEPVIAPNPVEPVIPTTPTEPTPAPAPATVEPAAVIQGAPEKPGDKPEAPLTEEATANAPQTPPAAPAAVRLPATGVHADGTPLSGEEKLFGAIGYIDILALVPLLARRDSEYCQHHGRQGLIVAVIFIFLWILAALSTTLAWIIVPLRIITIVAGFYLAYQGQWFQIPGVYDVSLKLRLDKPKPPTPPQA